mmetsp:Transcript_15484/g.33810  ORF Transcript_15484/g.33810 Transcript_15484/m.33810 type:complete len:215 (-) Transcript_15484:931-1575(-)
MAMLFAVRRRGRQVAATKGEREADGRWLRGERQAASKNHQVQKDRWTAKLLDAEGRALLTQQIVAGAVSVAVDAERERESKRSRKHTDAGAHFSATNVALRVIDQKMSHLNMKTVEAFRQVQPGLQKGEVGELPGRTAVQLRLRRAEFAAAELFPNMYRDANMFYLPFKSSMDTLLYESGWAQQHGVLPGLDGSYDMEGVKPYPFGFTGDGANL